MHYTARTEPLALLVRCHYALHSTNRATCSACSLSLCTTQHEQSHLLCLFAATMHYKARTEPLALLVRCHYALQSTNRATCSACLLSLCTTQHEQSHLLCLFAVTMHYTAQTVWSSRAFCSSWCCLEAAILRCLDGSESFSRAFCEPLGFLQILKGSDDGSWIKEISLDFIHRPDF
jgi:hypothetical protein